MSGPGPRRARGMAGGRQPDAISQCGFAARRRDLPEVLIKSCHTGRQTLHISPETVVVFRMPGHRNVEGFGRVANMHGDVENGKVGGVHDERIGDRRLRGQRWDGCYQEQYGSSRHGSRTAEQDRMLTQVSSPVILEIYEYRNRCGTPPRRSPCVRRCSRGAYAVDGLVSTRQE